MNKPRIGDLMTRDPVTVHPNDTVQRAAALMGEFNVGALPVCDGPQLVGIITDRDIAVRAVTAALAPERTPVDTVMTEHVRCCRTQETAAEVLALMASMQIRRVPVIDAAERLVGIVSLGDLSGASGAGKALLGISTPSEPDR